MSESNTTTLIIAVAVFLAVGLVVFFLRDKIKSGKVKVGSVSASVETHQPAGLNVNNIEQHSSQGSNEAAIHSTSATVNGFKQTARKDNKLEIGNPER